MDILQVAAVDRRDRRRVHHVCVARVSSCIGLTAGQHGGGCILLAALLNDISDCCDTCFKAQH